MKGNSSVRQQKSTEPLSLNGRKRAANVLGSFALAAMLCAMLTLFLLSLFYSARIRPGQYHIMSRADLFEKNELTNIAAFIVMVLVLWQIRRIKLTEKTLLVLGVMVLTAHLIIGLAWVFSIKGAPTCDAGILYDTLIKMRTGAKDTSFLMKPDNMYRYYLVSYPYQFVFFP